ncbi:MAG: PIN domain-containing protein [Caldilineae bacterium]|nr:MAG: PIN domain-containing protein [Caldilineae bacterium]
MEGQFVLDASVTMAWCFEDEASAYADAVLDSLTHAKAVVPAVWPLEVGNVLAVAQRRGRIDQAGSVRFVTLLMQLPIMVEPETPQRVFGEILALAREHDLSSYDASYLDLAMRAGIPLATQDKGLQQAVARAGVALYMR